MNMNKTKRVCGFVFIFLASFLVCLCFTGIYIQNKCQLEYSQMEHLALTKTSKLNDVISKLLYRTQTLSALVIQNNGEIKNFEQVAATIIDDPAIKNLILAPNGVVSHVYPLEGNEQVLGFDYFSAAEGNKEAVIAKDFQQLVLGGPFNLVQGGQALVGRLPVYIGKNKTQKQFWGLVSVTLNYPQALSGAELEQLKNQGFAYEIWRINPDTDERQIIASSNYTYNKNSRYVEQSMTILNADWVFRLSPIKNWYEYNETWIYSFLGLLISLLLAFLVMHNYDLKQMKVELEELTFHDPLTGILNRRGIFRILDSLLTDSNKKFILCYIDLNKFKYVNDTFGHNTGDKILQQFVYIIKKQMNKQHEFARMGGDEFILIFKNTGDINESAKFFEQLAEEFQKTISVNAIHKINLSFSMGKAVYPVDGETIDDLIAVADSAMYEEKQKL